VRKIVLIVEDDADVRDVIEEALCHVGYSVVCARDGAEGIRILKELVPNLILLDSSMPLLDGATFRSVLTEEPRLAGVPIVSISGLADVPAPALRKPFSIDRLLETVRRHCA
jgi:CheY-like chemotaxis protein